jgi:hypothetical protein
MSVRAADDFIEIRNHLERIRREEPIDRAPIGIAGPSGNPTQPGADPKTGEAWGGVAKPVPPVVGAAQSQAQATCKHEMGWQYVGGCTYKCKGCEREEEFYDE